MKKIKITLMILLVLGMAGCQRAAVTQTEKQPGTTQTQAAKTGSESKIIPTEKFTSENFYVNTKINGIYEGISTAGSCKFAIDLDVQDGIVKGEGTGTGPAFTCEIKLNGTVDEKGNMSGQAKAVYSVAGKMKIEWYLAGPFTRTADRDNKGDMTINLNGTGNNCALVAPKMPCSNNSDTIILELEKV